MAEYPISTYAHGLRHLPAFLSAVSQPHCSQNIYTFCTPLCYLLCFQRSVQIHENEFHSRVNCGSTVEPMKYSLYRCHACQPKQNLFATMACLTIELYLPGFCGLLFLPNCYQYDACCTNCNHARCS